MVPPLGDILEIRERSTLKILRDNFLDLENSDSFRALLEVGAVSLIRSKNVPYGISAGAIVGEAILDTGQRLIVKEKVEGTVRSLFRWALPQDIREAEAPSSISSDSPIIEIFSRRFLDFLRESLRFGRIKEYVAQPETSSLPKGRIDLRKTIALFSRGKYGKLAYRHTQLSADNTLNRLIALGLKSIETYGSAVAGSSELLEEARNFSILFEDVHSYSISRLPVNEKSELFETAFEDSRVTEELRNVLAYARALVLHLGAWARSPEESLTRSYFLNLETLFESAVREVLKGISVNTVHKGRALNRPLFIDLPERYIVDPDIVVNGKTEPLLVMDCKYKELDGPPAHSDVYQLASHCSALNCEKGVLIYPSVAFTGKRLGTTITGCEIWYGQVRLPNLADDLIRVLTEAGLLNLIKKVEAV